ncbi:DUF2285 domain-containing protein [Rhizobium sp. LC145]|uniref:DUF2285 domain-containing protein n=1 Tax=Rhizobium sp. LC145 TaxID=1120688 RepID=UPI000A4B8D80|nr:DUF2285 domain-containing protein [Rhizobium sp. LC145]MDX3927939.1 DUF2285 domain-containing protein [Shinella sp.]
MRLLQTMVVRDSRAGLHLQLSGREGDLNLWLPHGRTPLRAAFIIPIDNDIEIRLHSIQRAFRLLQGKPIGDVIRRQKLSAFHRHRYVQMLRAVDGLRSGASKREVASVLFSRDVRSFPAVEWRNASERRQLARLLAEANEHIERGYLRILNGGRTKGHLFRKS